MEIALVVLGIVFLIITLYKEWLAPAKTFLVVIVTFLITGILSPEEALEGFANKQIAIIIFLLILSNVFKRASTLTDLMNRFFKKDDNPKIFLLKMMSSIGLSSAFFNNTPLVAMMIPYVYEWARNKGISPSKFLLPLSYASILGGCITIIGTSTLLIVSGMAEARGLGAIDLLAVTPIGLTMFIIGILFLFFFSFKLLPNNKNIFKGEESNSRLFFVETQIIKDSSIIGNTVQEAGLRNLEDLFLVELNRNGKIIRAVSSNETLEEGDVLFFSGESAAIDKVDLEQYGLSWPQESGMTDAQQKDIVEVVLSHRSQLSGQVIRDSNFRSNFDAAVLAIHRNGERVWGQLGKVVLKSGDVLLLMVGQDFSKRIESKNDFYVISHSQKPKNTDFKKVLAVLLGMVLAIVLHALGLVSLFKSLLLLLTISVLTKTATINDIKSAIDYNLIMIIGLGLALGKAMENSGTSQKIAELIMSLSSEGSAVLFLSIIFIVTSFLSSIITSKAAVAVTFNISVGVGLALGVNIMPFILVVAFAGAANFITPIGYQTNMMVYGSGGYRFKDFVTMGLPITLVYMLVTIIGLSWWYDLF